MKAIFYKNLKNQKAQRKKAFSLVELSIVLLLFSIIISGMLLHKASDINLNKVKITKEKMAAIYKAMGIYLAKNGKLPCPARINLKENASGTDDENYGVAAPTCNEAPSTASGYWQSSHHDFVYSGMVPTTTLGLPIEYSYDGFGSKFSYNIINGFTVDGSFGLDIASTSDGGSGYYSTYSEDVSLGSGYRLFINDRKKDSSGSTVNTVLTDEAIFTIISHGANKSGAWNRNMTTQNTISSSDEEEFNSIVGSIDSPTTGKADFYDSSGSSGPEYPYVAFSNIDETFDDIVFYKTRDEMIYDFDLLNLIPCSSNFAQSITYGSPATYDWTGSTNIKYGELVKSDDACPSGYQSGPTAPAIKCGAFGNWDSTVVEPCIVDP